MRPVRHLAAAIAVAVQSSLAGLALAGDPLPDVDVSLGRKPNGSMFIEVQNGAPFDSLTLSGPKDFIGSLEVERLPPGWSMTRDGKNATFRGPAISEPTRLKLRSARTLDKSVDWDVSLAGRSLGRLKNVVPRTFDPTPVRNNLQGVVVMPAKVSPGEAIALRPLPTANLPPGRFVLSGVVTEPMSETEVTEARGGLAGLLALPADGFVLEVPRDTSCAEVASLAAALVTAQATGGCAQCKSFFESRSNTAKRAPRIPVTVSPTAAGSTSFWTRELRSSGHDLARRPINNWPRLFAVEPAPAGFTIDQKGVKIWQLARPSSSTSGSTVRLQVGQQPTGSKPPNTPHWVALELTETPAGCLFLPREIDLYDLARAQQKPREERPPGKPDRDATLQVGTVPDSVLPGTALSLQYLDVFGDAVVDVPVVSDTAVVPPDAEPEPPCVTAATAYAQAEDAVCVCGNFPSLAAQSGVWVDERDAGTPLSLSTRTLHYQLPRHALTPGRHVWSGNPEAGFAPSCRAQTQLVHIQGEIDSQRLLSGESTPMRLTVSGTSDKVPIQIKNLTPGIIRIEGGEVQTVESSGGNPNTLTKSVQGLVRGAFNVEWSLAVDRCPCP